MKPTTNSAGLKMGRPSRPVALSLGLIVATMTGGLVIRFIPLGLPAVIVKYGGSMLWALMIYWIISALLPSMRLLTVAVITAALTIAVEFFKLHHSPALDGFRMTAAGIVLLGRVFSLRDILAYLIAIMIGLLIDHGICSAANSTSYPNQRRL